MRTIICLVWAYLGLYASAQSSATPAVVDLNKTVTMTTHGTRLRRVFQLTAEQGIPVGIVMKDLVLCDEKQPRVYTAVKVSGILDSILSDSGHEWHLQNGVLQVRPSHNTAPLENRVLRSKLPNFGGFSATIQGLGIVLAGNIRSILHPGEGYAGSIMNSLDAETTPAFNLHAVSVEEAANYIVSLGSKGGWVLYQTDSAEVSLRAFGYKNDSNELRRITCIAGSR